MKHREGLDKYLLKLINSKKLIKCAGFFSLYNQKRIIQNAYMRNPRHQQSKIFTSWLTKHNINYNLSNKLKYACLSKRGVCLILT